MVWLYRDSMCHNIWGLICIRGFIFWMWVPWILNKCSLCNPQHRIHFYLQKAVASHLQPRKHMLPIPVRGSWLWLALFLILLLLCWVHLESSLSRLLVCSSVIAHCPSILRMSLSSMYSFPFLVLWVVTTWQLLFSFGSLPAVRVHLFSIFPILCLFIFGFLSSLYWYLVWVCFAFLWLLSNMCLLFGLSMMETWSPCIACMILNSVL